MNSFTHFLEVIYISYIVRTIFPSIWCFFQILIILFSFSILSKFASNSYAFPIVITQNYQDFCIWFQQNSHQLFSTVLIAMLLTASSHIWKQHDLHRNPNYFTTLFIHRISHSVLPVATQGRVRMTFLFLQCAVLRNAMSSLHEHLPNIMWILYPDGTSMQQQMNATTPCYDIQ